MSYDIDDEPSGSRRDDLGNRRGNDEDNGGQLGSRTFRSRGSRRNGDEGEPEPHREIDRTVSKQPPEPRRRDATRRPPDGPYRMQPRNEGRAPNGERRGAADGDRPFSRSGPVKSGFGLRGGRPSLESDQPRAYLTPHQERERRRRERMLEGDEGEEGDDEDEFNRIKGGRQPLRKKRKRKVRVYFHRRLTRLNLPKLLTKARYLSPLLARQFVESGRVKVNARLVTSARYEVNLRKERVTIDDMATEWPRRFSYMIYHKPRGVVCERGDAVFDELFDPESIWCFPFGRLSRSDSGLVVVSNDPRMRKNQHFVDDELQKEYRMRIHRHLTAEELSLLRNGVLVRGEYFVPLRVVAQSISAHTMTLDVTVLDDPYTHIYPALKQIGVEPLSTRRIRIGFLNEIMVPHAEWRELSGYEMQGLQLGRFTPGELPPEPDPEPRVRFQRPVGRLRNDRPRGRDAGGRGDRRDRSDKPSSRDGTRVDGRGRGPDRDERSRERGRERQEGRGDPRHERREGRERGDRVDRRDRTDRRAGIARPDQRREGPRGSQPERREGGQGARRTQEAGTDDRRARSEHRQPPTGERGNRREHQGQSPRGGASQPGRSGPVNQRRDGRRSDRADGGSGGGDQGRRPRRGS